MDTFADYILNEKNLSQKMEIVYYLSKRQKVYFDKTVVLKTELARLFMKYNNLDMDENQVLTASLLCNCKKTLNATDLETIRSYAKRGAEYLEQLGFNNKFCKMCEEINRYSGSEPREKESDVLELADSFGGMIIDRPDRKGFPPDEALTLLIHRNLKDKDNRYKDQFVGFIHTLQETQLGDFVEINSIKKLLKIYGESRDVVEFIKRDVNQFEPEIDAALDKKLKAPEEKIVRTPARRIEKANRPLFTEETTRMVLEKIHSNQREAEESEMETLERG